MSLIGAADMTDTQETWSTEMRRKICGDENWFKPGRRSFRGRALDLIKSVTQASVGGALK
jgi:hypothetical protein